MATSTKNSDPAPAMPPLTAAEFRQYNSLAEKMSYFHNYFRTTWTTIYSACSAKKRPANLSIRQFLALGSDFLSHLEMHHALEEAKVFPVLAKRMPAFKKELMLLEQHKKIHAGMDKMQEYIDECKSGERELRLDELKKVMDKFGDVLWTHLAEEEMELGAENMRKYWTVEEMKGFAF